MVEAHIHVHRARHARAPLYLTVGAGCLCKLMGFLSRTLVGSLFPFCCFLEHKSLKGEAEVGFAKKNKINVLLVIHSGLIRY
jgi:hypothetical protein